MKLLNAFSLQMLPLTEATSVNFKPCNNKVFETLKSDNALESFIGHQDLANILGVPMNRGFATLGKGEKALIAQVVGGRLPEGTTEIPEGMEIRFVIVEVQ